MKKHIVFVGIAVALVLSINVINGLCEDYRGKSLPDNSMLEKIFTNYYREMGANVTINIIGKIKDPAGNYRIYYFTTDKSNNTRRIENEYLIHLDTDLWLMNSGKKVMQK